MKTLATALALVLLAAAAPTVVHAQSAPATRPARVDRNVLTEEQIQAANKNSMYEVIESTRPGWLRARGLGSTGGDDRIKVYVDGMAQGSIATLRDLSPSHVTRVQRLDASNATTLYGTGHSNGAILITTKRGS